MEGAAQDSPHGGSISHQKPRSNHGLLFRIPFMRSSTDTSTDQDPEYDNCPPKSRPITRSIAVATSHQAVRTRRRRGSLRKAALLGRGAQREKRDNSPLTIDKSSTVPDFDQKQLEAMQRNDGLGLGTFNSIASQHPIKTQTSHSVRAEVLAPVATKGASPVRKAPTQPTGYNSTTDEEDVLQIPTPSSTIRSSLPISSGSDSYFSSMGSTRRRSFHQAKSPLSYSGLSATPLPPPDAEWDYSETEWWGWVILSATWFIFVIGMGSCLEVWTWAWDVGKTPYAPPELEDDPTLPIVGYYPTLLILTCIMAWVWVAVAWVGMKYFRHAKISGD